MLYAGLVHPTRLIREAMRQGENDLAYDCCNETRKRIDEGLRATLHRTRIPAEAIQVSELSGEFESVVEQVTDARYAELERYLQNGQWEEADNETYRLMIMEVGKEEEQWFDEEDLLNFPCEPLGAIDELWVKYSGGKFGFSVQKELYLKCGGMPDGKYHSDADYRFREVIGWNGGIRHDLESPKGHLPRNVLVVDIATSPGLKSLKEHLPEETFAVPLVPLKYRVRGWYYWLFSCAHTCNL